MDNQNEDNAVHSTAWKRMSLAQATEYAERLANDFMEKQEPDGGSWKCSGASPHSLDPQYRGRKVPINWSVYVKFYPAGFDPQTMTFDGFDNSLSIDIETGKVEFRW